MSFCCCFRSEGRPPSGNSAYKASPEAIDFFKKADRYMAKRDFTKYIQFLQKSAELGLADAQRELGVSYVDGDYVSQNSDIGRKWIKLAADQDDELAKQYLKCLSNLLPGQPFPPSMSHGNKITFITL